MSNHTNAEYLKALADGKLLQYTYLKVEECSTESIQQAQAR